MKKDSHLAMKIYQATREHVSARNFKVTTWASQNQKSRTGTVLVGYSLPSVVRPQTTTMMMSFDLDVRTLLECVQVILPEVSGLSQGSASEICIHN